jgi:hypothetical protein
VFEVMVWFPGMHNLNWWLCTGIAIHIARFLVKRKLAPEISN